jgi:hypothetical protein
VEVGERAPVFEKHEAPVVLDVAMHRMAQTSGFGAGAVDVGQAEGLDLVDGVEPACLDRCAVARVRP